MKAVAARPALPADGAVRPVAAPTAPTATASSPARLESGAPVLPELTTATQRAGIAALQLDTTTRARAAQRVRDYVTLTKPRIISLLLVTTVTPMIVADGGWPGMWLIIWTMLGGYLMAGGANAVNMYTDRDIDAVMTRTALRPIPSGRMSPGHVLGFGLVLAAAALVLLSTLVNALAACLAFAGFLYYVFVYTRWLKRRTPQNIVVGGAAGAFPPLVGWVAVTGSLSATAVLLFLIVVLWTPPHFWALALVKVKEYRKVGVPMAPNAWGAARTIRLMQRYALALVVTSLVPVALGDLGIVYGAIALCLGIWFIRDVDSLRELHDRTTTAWRVYRNSLAYLALLFFAMAADVVVGGLV